MYAPNRTSNLTDSDVHVSIKFEGSFSITVSWTFAMKNGSQFTDRYIKDFEVLQLSKDADGQYTIRRVLTKDRSLRQIDAGVSF
ncbi:hypothetical protein COOONC_19358 [Cooperia oncophora]